jgi:6-pyruvoyltetrahydropterin/6-carboxytetrahydropterin synthase
MRYLQAAQQLLSSAGFACVPSAGRVTYIPGMTAHFKVTVAKDYLTFSSAHFITFSGHQCESLHGHNYRVAVSVEGDIDPECAFVVDFAILKTAVRDLIKPMDHRVLLPTGNDKLGLKDEGESLVVDYFGKRRFQFPRADVCLLPISNTTAEMIAAYLAGQIQTHLIRFANLEALEVEVEESVGQSAYYRASLRD